MTYVAVGAWAAGLGWYIGYLMGEARGWRDTERLHKRAELQRRMQAPLRRRR
jgi:hypothetical protein